MSGVTATVNVQLAITVPSSWSDQTTMAQIKKQAIQDARIQLDKMCSEHSSKIKSVQFLSVDIKGVTD